MSTSYLHRAADGGAGASGGAWRAGAARGARQGSWRARGAPLAVGAAKVLKQPVPLVHEHLQPALGAVVLVVRLHVLGQLLDPRREHGHLHLTRARVAREALPPRHGLLHLELAQLALRHVCAGKSAPHGIGQLVRDALQLPHHVRKLRRIIPSAGAGAAAPAAAASAVRS